MNKLSNYADENIIIGGDFNCALTELDKIGGKPVERKSVSGIKFPNFAICIVHTPGSDHCAVKLFIQ